MMLLSDTIVDFHLFYVGAVDIQIWALLTRSQCKVSDTQVTVKACGPLVLRSGADQKPLASKDGVLVACDFWWGLTCQRFVSNFRGTVT